MLEYSKSENETLALLNTRDQIIELRKKLAEMVPPSEPLDSKDGHSLERSVLKSKAFSKVKQEDFTTSLI